MSINSNYLIAQQLMLVNDATSDFDVETRRKITAKWILSNSLAAASNVVDFILHRNMRLINVDNDFNVKAAKTINSTRYINEKIKKLTNLIADEIKMTLNDFQVKDAKEEEIRQRVIQLTDNVKDVILSDKTAIARLSKEIDEGSIKIGPLVFASLSTLLEVSKVVVKIGLTLVSLIMLLLSYRTWKRKSKVLSLVFLLLGIGILVMLYKPRNNRRNDQQ